MVLAADYPLGGVIISLLAFVALMAWLWMLILVIADIFARHDISGWAKAGWLILAFFLPVVGVIIYLIAEGHGMAERRTTGYAYKHQDEPRTSDGAAAEIEAAKRLLDSGAIDQQEYERLKRKAMA